MENTFEFRKARIVGGDEGAGVGVMGGLQRLDGKREEGSGNLFGDEERGITSVEEGLGEVRGVGVEVIWVTCTVTNSDLPVPIHTQSHQLPFQECWSIRIIHKLPDTTRDHIRRQHETAY